MVIQSYLDDELLGDAATALLQHKQDFGEESHAQKILQARTMIIAGRPEAVESILKNREGAEVQALRLLARFYAKRGNSSSIGDQAQRLAQQEGLSELEQRRFWIIASKVALQAGKRLKRVVFLEHVLALEMSPPAYDSLFTIKTDELWSAYLSAGQKFVSQYWPSRDDEKLLEAALTLDERDPIKSRSIYSVLALEGLLPRYRELAHQRLTDSLLNQEDGEVIVNALYTKSTRFKDFSEIPSVVRARLSDYNLARGDVNLAKRLLMGMKQPPEGYKIMDWQLLLSRVAILSGRDKMATKMLHEMLVKFKTLDSQQAERIMRVILDLQRIGEYKSSIELYGVLLPLLSEPQQKRQIWYRQAEAYRMLKDLKIAAFLYLQSAVFGEEGINSDPWGQYTRFLAAGTLTEAGLIDDASRIYQQLLQDTEAPGRRAVILYKLQLLPLTR
jgi:tetratricopeptide (TPR) repeat protein